LPCSSNPDLGGPHHHIVAMTARLAEGPTFECVMHFC
jgi:hypothetical protein